MVDRNNGSAPLFRTCQSPAKEGATVQRLTQMILQSESLFVADSARLKLFGRRFPVGKFSHEVRGDSTCGDCILLPIDFHLSILIKALTVPLALIIVHLFIFFFFILAGSILMFQFFPISF